MSIQVRIEGYLDDSDVTSKQVIAEARNKEISEKLDENEKRTRESFKQVVGVMRAGYMMVSGLAQVMGGSMGQIISSIYGTAVAGIATYTAIHTALLASPDPTGRTQIQAGMALIGLGAALGSLLGVMTGQEELARGMNGLNMSLQGIGSMIANFSVM